MKKISKKKVRRDYTRKFINNVDIDYVKELVNMLSILHDMKHDGSLPVELQKYRGIIEFFSPDKLGLTDKDLN